MVEKSTGNENGDIRNVGDWNSGIWDAGDGNSGKWNVGNRNSGNQNVGDRNTGHGNWGDSHVGCFNTVDAKKAYYFNTLCDIRDWMDAYKPDWLYTPKPTEWVSVEDMTEWEKRCNPRHKTTGGFLRINSMVAEWAKAHQSASEADIQAVRALPGFDPSVFKELTGLDLSEAKPACCGGIIEIVGVKYKLTKV